jgi:bifunctional DNase/RNase
MAENPDGTLEMVVESVRVQMSTGRHVLLLKEVGLGRILPIWIGPWEASAIAMRLQGVTPERPLTHDLLGSVIGTLGARVERIVIVSLADETFHARLVLVTPDARLEVDARPSDAVALAVRLEVPIFASTEVLDRAAKVLDLEGEDDEPAGADERAVGAQPSGRPPVPRETPGGPVDAASLEIFRDFVNSLDFEDKGGGAKGGS